MDMQKVGTFLSELRKERNLTQDELGEQIGVTNKRFHVGKTAIIYRPLKCCKF